MHTQRRWEEAPGEAMDDDHLFATCRHSPQCFPALVSAILHAFAEGEVTEWVIQHGTHFERAAWAALLIEAVAEDETFLSHAEMVELFGARWARQFRLGLHRLRKKIQRHFATKAR